MMNKVAIPILLGIITMACGFAFGETEAQRLEIFL
jgi:hypothetical protein